MKTHFVEASNGFNWGKFMLARFDAEEWNRKSAVDNRFNLPSRGWEPRHLLVLDLQTGEGAIFMPNGSAHHDLEKHQIWVCPLFEPFLTWLWTQDVSDIMKIPALINLPEVEGSLAGYRRPGPTEEEREKHGQQW